MTAPLDPLDSLDDAAPAGRRRWPILAGAGALIVAGVAIGVWALVPPAQPGPGATTPPSAASPSPSASASASAQAAEPPAAPTSAPPAQNAGPAAPVVEGFTVSSESVTCADERSDASPLTFSWSSTDATRAWIGIGTNDASVQPSAEVPLSASGYAEIAYDCRDPEQLFTLTVEGPGGRTSGSLSVTRVLG